MQDNEKYLNHAYNTSKDYDKLFELILKKEYRIVCFVKYRDSSNVKDVCSSPATDLFASHLTIGSRGMSYIDAMDFGKTTMKDDFIEQCIANDLEFIPPTKIRF